MLARLQTAPLNELLVFPAGKNAIMRSSLLTPEKVRDLFEGALKKWHLGVSEEFLAEWQQRIAARQAGRERKSREAPSTSAQGQSSGGVVGPVTVRQISSPPPKSVDSSSSESTATIQRPLASAVVKTPTYCPIKLIGGSAVVPTAGLVEGGLWGGSASVDALRQALRSGGGAGWLGDAGNSVTDQLPFIRPQKILGARKEMLGFRLVYKGKSESHRGLRGTLFAGFYAPKTAPKGDLSNLVIHISESPDACGFLL